MDNFDFKHVTLAVTYLKCHLSPLVIFVGSLAVEETQMCPPRNKNPCCRCEIALICSVSSGQNISGDDLIQLEKLKIPKYKLEMSFYLK